MFKFQHFNHLNIMKHFIISGTRSYSWIVWCGFIGRWIFRWIYTLKLQCVLWVCSLIYHTRDTLTACTQYYPILYLTMLLYCQHCMDDVAGDCLAWATVAFINLSTSLRVAGWVPVSALWRRFARGEGGREGAEGRLIYHTLPSTTVYSTVGLPSRCTSLINL